MILGAGLRAASICQRSLESQTLGWCDVRTDRPTEMPKGKNKNKRKSAGGEILCTPEKKAAEIMREKVGLSTPSPTPTLVAAKKGTLAAIPELFDFTLCGDVEGYETVELDSDSDSTSSMVSAIFTIGGDTVRKGKEKEDSDNGSDDGSRFWGETMREG